MQGTQHSRLFERLLGRAPDYVSFGLVIVFGFLLARLTWMFFPTELRPLLNDSASSSVGSTAPPANSLGDKLASYHLFGQYQADGSKPTPSNIQPTQLALKLQGIYAPARNKGFAVIEEGSQQKTYAVGDSISTSGAVLEQVLADHVLLRRNGLLEKLALPKPEASGKGTPSGGMGMDNMPSDMPMPDYSASPDMMPPADMLIPTEAVPPPLPEMEQQSSESQGIPPESTATPASSLGDFRQSVLNNNMRLMEVASPQPYERDGKFLGFQLSPGSNVAMFNQLGLQAGDIVTAVNGTPLENPAIAMRMLQEAGTATQINLSITRNGQEVSLPINF
ncbi:type II secretion system protein GspC [Thiothrix lacustris]|uniref:Type II secretion system protein GspC n=1 Tax=Thiothrix lacustris TaxID=525917 RepID=A0ABY9MLE4_9GAMM|nr:type II secretion system protein GspC [Thiothrix lacustris]WML89137.1 type II secretion system protein GspC [Thiothrix lacustris]